MFPRLLRSACAGLLGIALSVSAAPYTPGSDTQVLERLPVKAADPTARELRVLRAELAARPTDTVLAEKAPHASELFATGCLAYVDATTGQTRSAYDRLAAVLQRHPEASSGAKLWKRPGSRNSWTTRAKASGTS